MAVWVIYLVLGVLDSLLLVWWLSGHRAGFRKPKSGHPGPDFLGATGEPSRPGAAGRLSLVIPAYNEATRIGNTVIQTARYIETLGLPAEIIVVDDGSQDDTAATVRALQGRFSFLRLVRLPANRGKGAAVRQGFEEACGDVVVFFDADLAFPLEQISLLLEQIGQGYHIAIGQRRNLQDETRSITWARRLVSLGARSLPRLLGLTDQPDTQCGFKAFRRQDILPLLKLTHVDRFAFDVEWLYLARRLGLKVAQVPVVWYGRAGSSVRLGGVLESAWSLVKIRMRTLAGLYVVDAAGAREVRGQVLSAALIFVAALAVRLPYLWTVPVSLDEWGEVGLAYQIYLGKTLPLHNTAHDIGALFNYLLAGLFKLFGPSIYLPRLLVAVLSALTVVLLYFWARAVAGRLAAWLAAAFLTTCGLDVIVGHWAWSNDITPFFVTAAALTLTRAVQRKNSRFLVLSALLWGLALQTHSSVLAFLPGMYIYLWLGPVRRGIFRGRALVAAHLAFVAAYANMIWDNIAVPLDSWHWIHDSKAYAFNGGAGSTSYLHNFGGILGQYLSSMASAYPWQYGIHQPVNYILVAAVSVLLAAGAVHAATRQDWLPVALLFSGLIIMPVFNHSFGFYTPSVRYLASLFPAGFLLVADSLAAGWERLRLSMAKSQEGQRRANWRLSLLSGLAATILAATVLLPLWPLDDHYRNLVAAGQDDTPAYELTNIVSRQIRPGQPIIMDGLMAYFNRLTITQMLQVEGLHNQTVAWGTPGTPSVPSPANWLGLMGTYRASGLVAVLSADDFNVLTRDIGPSVWSSVTMVHDLDGRVLYAVAITK